MKILFKKREWRVPEKNAVMNAMLNVMNAMLNVVNDRQGVVNESNVCLILPY
ncbi:MAG: hypothetical protein MUC95_03385 [Spirochaetes bacterium]|nr:hypothetical protein [Spirochaetota bacterium]